MKDGVNLKILLVSPLPPPKGGIATWTEEFVEYYHQNHQICEVVNTAVIGKRAINFSEHKNPVLEIFRAIRILEDYCIKLWRFDPDIVHINTSCAPAGLFRDYCCILLTPKNKKIVLHCRCTIEDQLKRSKWGKRVFLKVLKHVSGVLVLNDRSKQFVKEVAAKDAIKVPNYIREDYIRSTRKPIREKIERLIYTGHLLQSKGINEILLAAKKLPHKMFVLVGSISDEYKNREIPTNVIMMGNLSADKVQEQLDMADVFIFPSYTEGFSNSLVEAMARGLPVITTKVGANMDMIENIGGIYVPIGSAEALVDAILYIESPEIRNTMSEWNVQKVKNCYRISCVMQRLESIYKDMLEN